MKFPYSMLLDFVQTKLDAEQVGDLLTMAGFELEGIEVVEGEPVLDIKVVSNRGDGLSVFGLAREVLAKDGQAEATELYFRAVSRFSVEGEVAVAQKLDIDQSKVTIESSNCTRYACRLIENVPNAQAPTAIQKRLRQAGVRPISLLVDLTNYVMLEVGQPLHAFDYDKLAEHRIVVRDAILGEKLTTLNGEEHELKPGLMMICDAEKPVGAPGTMGGLDTEVTPTTERMLLESAHFVNTAVRKIRKSLGLSTEASYRFERSVDPAGVAGAIRRFTELLYESAPEIKVSNIVDSYPGKEDRPPIRLRIERSDMLLGMSIEPEQAEGYLSRLGFDVELFEGLLDVTPPTWRPDVVREEDLVEELGRVHGYEKIPELLPQGSTPVGGPHGFELWQDQVRLATVNAGFVQIVSHSLRDLHPLDDRGFTRIGPRNPGSPENAYLRNSLWPSLADAAKRNGGRNIHLFETGKVFFGEDGKYEEFARLSAMSQGSLVPTDQVVKAGESADFFSLKGAVESVLAAGSIQAEFQIPPEKRMDARLHPTRQALIWVGDRVIGNIGQLHPDIADEVGLPADTVVAELMLEPVYSLRSTNIEIKSISRNPSVRRDMAILVDKSVPYEQIATILEQAAGDVLERHWLFEVYDGKGIPEGKHSLNVALQLRKFGENFTDEEANLVREKVVAALSQVGATTR